jgi:hypothetical protein
MNYIKYTHYMQNKLNMQNMQKKLTFPTDRINLLSDAIDTFQMLQMQKFHTGIVKISMLVS